MGPSQVMGHRCLEQWREVVLFVDLRGRGQNLEPGHPNFHIKGFFDNDVVFEVFHDVDFKRRREKVVSNRTWQGLVSVLP